LRRVGTAFTVATVGMAAFAASAQAATLSIDPAKACYVSGESANVLGAGYTAGSTVTATFAGQTATFPVDAAGNTGLTLNFLAVKGVKTVPVTLTDDTNPANTASLPLLVTRLHVDVNPTHAAAGKKLRIKGYGLLGGSKVYMHVRGPGGYRADTRIAKSHAPCGTFKTHRKMVPAGARSGAYKVRFDAKKKYSKKTRPQTGGTLTITRTFHAVGARAAAFGGVGLVQRWTSVSG
jgi:hypothetical protein